MAKNIRRHCFFKTFAAAIFILILGGAIPLTAQSTPVDAGYRDFHYGDGVIESITGEKPESKLWWNDGYWWGSLWDTLATEYRIFRFDVSSQSWVNTGTAIDDRNDTKADALSDGVHLYIASHVFSESAGNTSESNSARLYRYSYNANTKTYSLDSGFPVVINNAKSESLVLDKDSTGKLWITWIQSKKVKINCSVDGDRFWGEPFNLPVLGDNTSSDDISSLVAFDGKIGVFWSNQDEEEAYFAVHNDGAPETTWQPRETAIGSLSDVADDHLNLSTACDENGNIYATLKTSRDDSDEPGLYLLKRDAQGIWTHHLAALVEDDFTRAIVLVDSDNDVLYLVAKAKEDGRDTINMKSASLTDLVFPEGPGTMLIGSAEDDDINNPTSTKQCLTNESGLLVLASDKTSKYYFHNYLFPLGEVDNLAPVISEISDQEVSAEETLVVEIEAVDPDEDAIELNVIGLPDFAEFNDNGDGSGSITFSPGTADGGEYLIRVIATDNGEPPLSRTETFLLTVIGINHAPTLTVIDDVEMNEADTLDITISATDIDGDNLTLTIAGLPEFAAFIDSGNGSGSLRFTPGFFDAGDDEIEITATDDGFPPMAGTNTFSLTVNNLNRPPVIEPIADQAVAEKDTLTVTVSATDADEDDISLIVFNLPQFASFVDSGNGNGSFHFTPLSTDAGFYPGIILTATDDGTPTAASADTFNLSIIDHNEPPLIDDIPNQTIAEGEVFAAIHLDSVVTDPDNADSALAWSFSGNSQLSISIDENRIATIAAPSPEWSGAETITFTVTDPAGLSDSDSARFTVTAVNDTPMVAGIADQTIDEGQSFAGIALDNFVEDVDNSDDELAWSVSGNIELTITIDENRLATIAAPNIDWNGSEILIFTASDSGGLASSDSAIFTVSPINDAPVIGDIPDQAITEGELFSTIILDDFVNDIDNPDSTLTWSTSGNTELTIIITEDRIATITAPNVDWNGGETIMFTVTDSGGLSASDSALFAIESANDSPITSDIPDQTITEGSSFTAIFLDDFVTDIDNTDNEISWSVNDTVALSVNIDENRIATITPPTADWNGSETLVFIAADPGGLSDSSSATFTVTAVNDAPVVSDIPDQTIAEGSSFATIFLDEFVEDVDDPDHQINWSISGNSGLGFAIDANRMLTIEIPIPDWNGSETFIFTAADTSGLTANDSAVFTITAVNDTPLVSNIPDQIIQEGQEFASIFLDDFVEDLDAPDSLLSWTVNGNHLLNISIDPDRVARITPPDANWHGSEAIRFTASDPGGLFASDSATFTITAVNDAPQISDTLPVLFFNEDDSLLLSISDWYQYVEDVDLPDSSLVFQISGGQFIAVSQVDVFIELNAPENWFGNDSLQLLVSDGEFADSAKFAVTVLPVNDAPEITSLPDSILIIGDSSVVLNLGDFVQDIDTPDSLLSWHFQKSSNLLLSDYDAATAQLTLTGRNLPASLTLTATVFDDLGESDSKTIIVRINQLTSIEDAAPGALPNEYALFQNFPNPFNPSTQVKFALPKPGNLTLEVYNVLGEKVTTLWGGFKPAGFHIVEFNAANLSSGVYFYRLQAREFSSIKKMILLR